MPLLGLLLFVAGLCLVPMAESDLFFHLKVGDEILRTGAIPHRNLFSFTFPDQPDPDPAWLFDVAVSALYRLGGFPAVVVGKTIVVVAVFAGAYLVCRRRGASTVAAAVALSAAALVMRERLVERPHLFSLAGEVAVLAALTGARRAWLVPATALWANLHAGAFVGPALLFAAVVGSAIDSRGRSERNPRTGSAPPAMGYGGPSPPAPDALIDRRTLATAAACALALLATPVGTGIFRYLAFHADIFKVHPVDEFRPISWTSDAPLIAFAVVTGALAVLVRPRWREALPALALAMLAARSARFGADFALVAAPLLATALSQRLPRLDDRRIGAIAGTALVALAIAPRALARQRPRLDLDTTEIPLEAIAFAEANGLRERMYNDFELGAYLLWKDYPRYRVFVDPRLPAYPRAFHRLLGDPHLDRAAWDAALDGFGVSSALVGYAGINHRISWWDPDRWALLYRAHDARVFVRRLPRWRDLIATHEIPATFAFTVEEGARTIPLEAPPAGSPVAPCEWQRRLGDLLFELGGAARALPAYERALQTPGCLAIADERATAAWIGAELLERGQPAAALPFLDRAGDELTTLTNRALALERLGHHADAVVAWRQVADRARGTPLGDRAAARARR
jgi:tetratricopeptide (TPR) repeat protein